jgi:sterol desaturase/sphingolipid hydroxylase (fatty acid hydroxylase superfamily)
MLPIVYFAIPGFFVLLLLERAWLRRAARLRRVSEDARACRGVDSDGDQDRDPGRHGPRDFRGTLDRDTHTSLLMGLGNVAMSALVQVPTFGLYAWLWEYRLFDPGAGPAAWAMLFFAEDFVYYGWHRASHGVRFMWAAHVNHHSSEYFNLSTALRQSWTTPFTVPLFYAVLPLAGFSPGMIAAQVSISLIYQFWIHTELIGRLPRPFEAIFNTPSHHRVHHGANVEYLDRNHGGILIVWDRLFGTFEPERERVVYGLTKNVATDSLIRVAFHDWVEMVRSVRQPAPFSTRLAYVFAPPGWSTDGSTRTAAELRRSRTARAA